MTLMLGQSTKAPLPLPGEPGEFARCFIEGGWRRLERVYGARTDRLVAWMHLAGGTALDEARRAFLKTGKVEVPEVSHDR